MGDYYDLQQTLNPLDRPNPCNCEERVFSWASGLRVYVDGMDITYFAFGVASITPDEFNHKFKDIDLSAYVDNPGRHYLTITSETYGLMDTRLEVK